MPYLWKYIYIQYIYSMCVNITSSSEKLRWNEVETFQSHRRGDLKTKICIKCFFKILGRKVIGQNYTLAPVPARVHCPYRSRRLCILANITHSWNIQNLTVRSALDEFTIYMNYKSMTNLFQTWN